MEVYKDYAYYYNAFYQEKNYYREVLQIDKLFKKYGKNIRSIINYGCGTGRHDVEMLKLGYENDGIDMSPNMIRIARENAERLNLKINYSVADIRSYNSEKKYDAVVSLFHVISYQNLNKDVSAAFLSARRVLSKDGLFIFDVWYGPGVLSDKPSIRVREVEDDKNRLIRIARPVMHDKTNVVDVCYEIFIIDKETGNTKNICEKHQMRYFFRPEIEKFLSDAGFELIDNFDCLTLESTTFESWTCYFVAKVL